MVHLIQFTKRYGNQTAVENVELFIPEGEVFGLIGPNGAGKTTVFNFLATLLPPTSGGGRICGYDVVRYYSEVRQLVGFMPDHFGVYPGMLVEQFLRFFGKAHGLSGRESGVVIDDILQLVDLSDVRSAPVNTLSRGMRQRLCLGRALIHNPRVLILDEPASGLDPRARREMRDLIRALAGMGKTILISSHILSELGDVCSSIGFLDHGRLIKTGTLDEILKAVRPHRVFLVEWIGASEPVMEALQNQAMIRNITEPAPTSRGTMRAGFQIKAGNETIAAIQSDIVRRGGQLIQFDEQEVDLEEAFIQVTDHHGLT
jgi:ABC-2 type transport system ATP-binding protein